MSKRPTFFLSSTIYDFRDLRSAIKFSLEARGCRVLASECNDFEPSLSDHSYEACLKNIEQADYFVLLIGGRVGGWYNKDEKISITRQEYRAAYERQRRGQLKIVTLVRSEVWQLKEDRKSLAKHIAKMDFTKSQKVLAAEYPSKFAEDAEFVSDFIDEVGRNAETGNASKAGGEMPTGNWIYIFSDFRGVHDVLHPLAFSGSTADEAAYAKALEHEILEVRSKLLMKYDGKPLDVSGCLQKHIADWPITKADREADYVRMPTEQWHSFSSTMMHLLGTSLNMYIIEDALTSSIFLEYDIEYGSYIQTSAHDALHKLVCEIRLFNNNSNSENFTIVYEFSPKSMGRKTGTVSLPFRNIALLYSIAQRWINILRLTASLAGHLSGKPFLMPALMPFSPVVGLDEAISKERVSIEEARRALAE